MFLTLSPRVRSVCRALFMIAALADARRFRTERGGAAFVDPGGRACASRSQTDLKNLNPLLNSNTTDVFVDRLMFEPLVTADAKRQSAADAGGDRYRRRQTAASAGRARRLRIICAEA